MLDSAVIISFREFVVFFSIHFNFFFFNSSSSSGCGIFHTMINKFEYVDVEMFISETDFSYHQILFCTAISPESCRFESFVDELPENSLTFRNSLFFSGVFVCAFDGIILEIKCRVTEIADAN